MSSLDKKKTKIPQILIDSLTEDTKIYLSWLDKVDIDIDKNLFFAGSFNSPEYPVWPRTHDNFHFPLGMKKLLRIGFPGIKRAALEKIADSEGNEKKYLRLIYGVYQALCRKISRFAGEAREIGCKDIHKTCYEITRKAPCTFRQACQLYWFATIFRAGTATIGRLDQHLFSFYQNDLRRGTLTKEQARAFLSELLYRYEKRGAQRGDTLQNITLGGRSSAGKDQTNDLTYMILELMLENKYIEPKINVRLHEKSPDYLLELVARLQISGTGICTVYNDDAIIDGLKNYGRPAKIAADYCADGCTEIILDGYGETSFRYIDCVKAVEHAVFNGEENIVDVKGLRYYDGRQECVNIRPPVPRGKKTGNFLDMRTFREFYNAYLSQLKYQVDVMLSTAYNADDKALRPFVAATMPNVLEKAQEPYSSKSCWHTYGLFIGSLGTAANSIAAVKFLVYDQKLIKKEELLEALRNNFEGAAIVRKQCLQAPKFGNNDDYVDAIASDIAEHFASWVKKYRERTGKPILPGLYNHLFHHTAYYVGATPDGRKTGDPVGEHLSPTPGTTLDGPTSIIHSVCKIKTADHIFGSTLHLNIPLSTLKGTPDPAAILKCITRGFCLEGGCVLNINILDSVQLLEAQRHPEKYRDLVVRVWGFSYYFVGLSKEMQDHVIARSQSEWSA